MQGVDYSQKWKRKSEITAIYLGMRSTMTNDSEVRNLIEKAFYIARQQGKPDWRKMTIAVLKNRLIQLSNGTFSEHDLGSNTFREFVQKLDDLLQLDTATHPATVTLIDSQGSEEDSKPDHSSRSRKTIRPDLWDAIVDFRSGKAYGWDSTRNIAREVLPGETLKILPTIDTAIFAEWRKGFAERHIDKLSEPALTRLQRWQSEGLGTSFLPSHLIGLWNEELKSLVERRLNDWFIQEHIDISPFNRSPIKRPDVGSDVSDLRSIIIDCVRVMTREELEQLWLPPAAILRSKTKKVVP